MLYLCFIELFTHTISLSVKVACAELGIENKMQIKYDKAA